MQHCPPTPRQPIGRGLTIALSAVVLLVLSGCGETYVEDRATFTTLDLTATTTLPPVPADADTDQLLTMMQTELEGLSTAVVEENDPESILARVEEIWGVLQPKIASDAVTERNLQSGMDFAVLAVERKRPADADKAVKIVTDEIDTRQK